MRLHLTQYCTRWLTVIALTLATAAFVACGDNDNGNGNGNGGDGGESATGRFVIVSGGTGGVYYPTATKITELARKANDGLLIDNRTSGGSTVNARRLHNGDAHFALMQNNIAAYAREGIEMFEEDGRITGIRGVAALYPEHIQIVARADSGIERITDLRNKDVAIGAVGSGTAVDARHILEAYGVSVDDLGQVERLTASESAAYLQDGRIDAAFFTFGVGTSAIQELANTTTIRFVPVEGEMRDALIEQYPYYSKAVIDAEAYRPGDAPAGAMPPEDVPTVSVMATLVAHEDVPAPVVETVLRGMFDNITELRIQHDRLGGINKTDARNNLSMPLHEGARAYYGEDGENGEDDDAAN